MQGPHLIASYLSFANKSKLQMTALYSFGNENQYIEPNLNIDYLYMNKGQWQKNVQKSKSALIADSIAFEPKKLMATAGRDGTDSKPSPEEMLTSLRRNKER